LKLHSIQNQLIVIAGPTASGKSELAVSIAKYFNSEIISADSRQFYKEIPIGTAAPSIELQQETKHHFVGNLSVTQEYNVSKYEQDVLKLIKISFQEKSVMMLVGGSGLYIDAVCNGIDLLPETDMEIRKSIQKMYHDFGLKRLQDELQRLDPEYFSIVDKNNPVRLMRALEICHQTGKKYSDLRQNEKKSRDFKIIKIALDVPRQKLNERIDKRVEEMINLGWIDEARSVCKYKHLNPLNTVGYKELFNYLDNKWPIDFAVEKIKINTRRYAKRQMTWFRKEKDYKWFSPDDKTGIIQFISNKICS
jgi:tRNA dimethylallyltransferase